MNVEGSDMQYKQTEIYVFVRRLFDNKCSVS